MNPSQHASRTSTDSSRSHGSRRHRRRHLQSQAVREATTVALAPETTARLVVQSSTSTASASFQVQSLPASPQPGSHLPSRRHVATWAFSSGSEAPLCFVSTKRGKEQRKVENDTSGREIPRILHGRTVSAMVEASGGVVMAPDPSALYCGVCGVLRLCRSHNSSWVHKLHVRGAEPAAGEPGTDPATEVVQNTDPDVNPALLHSIVGTLASDPVFAATIAAAIQQATALAPLHSSVPSPEAKGTNPAGESLDFDVFA